MINLTHTHVPRPLRSATALLMASSLMLGINQAAVATDKPRAIPGPDAQTAEAITILIVVRDGPNNQMSQEMLRVPSTEAAQRKAELLNDPAVRSVKEAVPTRRPAPNRIAPRLTPQSGTTSSQSQQGPRPPLLYNDPVYGQQTHFDPTLNNNLKLESALKRLTFKRKVRVGVIDGGFDRSVDMEFVAGYNFMFPRGPQFYNSDPDTECDRSSAPFDLISHGQAVAHIIGAMADNSLGGAGAARNVEMVAGRASDCTGLGFDGTDAEAIWWMVGDHRRLPPELPRLGEPVQVINISAAGHIPPEHGRCTETYQDAIDSARASGAIIVAAAGNNGDNADHYFPANCDGVISVAGTRKDGTLYTFSNTGSTVDIAAQAVDVITTNKDGHPEPVVGTSFSAPLVTGLIAAALSERPNLTHDQIKAMLAVSGNPVLENTFPGYNVQNRGVGGGALDAMKFLDAAGIPREIVGAQTIFDGERERYVDALTHPAALDFLQRKTGGNACSLVELDSRTMPNANPKDLFTVFAVPDGEPLEPNVLQGAQIIAQTPDNRMVLSETELSNPTKQYGLARCDIRTGANCNQIDTIRALELNNLSRPAQCNTVLASN